MNGGADLCAPAAGGFRRALPRGRAGRYAATSRDHQGAAWLDRPSAGGRDLRRRAPASSTYFAGHGASDARDAVRYRRGAQSYVLHDSARYDGNITPHHHVVCVHCRRIRDVEIPDSDRLFAAIGARRVHRIGWSLEIQALCEECQSEKRASAAGRNRRRQMSKPAEGRAKESKGRRSEMTNLKEQKPIRTSRKRLQARVRPTAAISISPRLRTSKASRRLPVSFAIPPKVKPAMRMGISTI